MFSRLLIALAVAGSAPLAVAAPVTITCAYRGPGHLGPLTVTADEAQKLVIVRTALGETWTLRDGVTTRYRPAEAEGDDYAIETEFVTFKPDRVEVGIRDPEDGALVHLSWFNRSALGQPPKRCRWTSLWTFRRA